MAFPSSPTDGQKYTKDNADIYQYSSANNAWSIIGHAGGLGDIYICSNNPNINCGNVASGGTIIPYSINISNYIYTFAYGLGGNYQFMCLYFPIDSSAFPIRFNASTSYGPFPAFTLISQYLDNGVVYINGQVGSSYYYDTFTIASKSFSTGNPGSHTSGTLINSALQLNGFQYDSVGQSTNSSGATLVDIRTKVTKL